jgi:hypothetical protein
MKSQGSWLLARNCPWVALSFLLVCVGVKGKYLIIKITGERSYQVQDIISTIIGPKKDSFD